MKLFVVFCNLGRIFTYPGMKLWQGTDLTLRMSAIIALGFRALKFVPPLFISRIILLKYYTKCICIDSLHNIVILVSFTPLNWVFLALFHNQITFVNKHPISSEY